MSKLLVVLGLLLAPVLTGVANSTLRVEPSSINFGAIIAGIQAEAEIQVINEGAQPISILGANVTCGCFCGCKTSFGAAVAQLIPPHGRATIKVVMDTSYLEGDVEEVVHLHTTEGDLAVTLGIEVMPAQTWQKSVSRVKSDWIVLIDVREPEAYASSHLLGAVNLPAGEDSARALRAISEDVFVLLYDEGEEIVPGLLQNLHGEGLCHLWELESGLAGWRVAYGDSLLVSSESDSLPQGGDATLGTPCGKEAAGQSVSVESLHRWFFVMIDLRPPASFAKEHLFGAISIQAASILQIPEWIPKDVPLIVYSETGTQDEISVQQLRDAGYQTFSLLGGLDEWKKQFGKQLIVGTR